MKEETTENLRPRCPYCDDQRGECKHVLLDYDASFRECLSGYLLDNNEEMDELKSSLLELIKSDIKPVLKNSYLENIWEYAVASYTPESDEIEFDNIPYFNFLKQEIYSYGGEYEYYYGEDGSPGYSSAYVVYFAKEPKLTMQQINAHLLDVLK